MSSVQKQIMVDAPPERAFRVFTEKFDSWWPRGHHIGKAEMKSAVMEGREKGRWYEVGVDGSECDWGYVLVWDPPRRVVLAWQLNAQWQYDPSLTTEVEVTFTPLGAASTRVELEHRYLERFGEMEESVRKGIDSEEGWGGLLRMYADAARDGSPSLLAGSLHQDASQDLS
jgi:uncharacterized protein YndB with AHSA1/START domain